MYEEVHPSQCSDHRINQAFDVSRKLARRIEGLEKEADLAASLNRSMSVPGATVPSRLLLTVKSHKPDGQVGSRNVHASPSVAFAGLAAWVSKVCRDVKRDCAYILGDSASLVDMLRHMEARSDMTFVKLDRTFTGRARRVDRHDGVCF